MGVPVRKVPAILKEFTGVEVTQSALTQDALKKASGVIGNVYQELRASVATAPVVYTDDTSWPIHGQAAHLMAFDTDQATVFQIRKQHRNEEVREVIPADYAGVMVTDRGKSYEADELSEVDQQKCLDHLNNNIDEVLETKTGPARSFGLKLKRKLKDARQLWRKQRAGQAADFQAKAEQIEQDLTHHLRHRFLKDQDNQRLLDGIGLQHDLGRVLRFLHNPAVEPTNNRGERGRASPGDRPQAFSRVEKRPRGGGVFCLHQRHSDCREAPGLLNIRRLTPSLRFQNYGFLHQSTPASLLSTTRSAYQLPRSSRRSSPILFGNHSAPGFVPFGQDWPLLNRSSPLPSAIPFRNFSQLRPKP